MNEETKIKIFQEKDETLVHRDYLNFLMSFIYSVILMAVLWRFLHHYRLSSSENLFLINLVLFIGFSGLPFLVSRLLQNSGWRLKRVWMYRLAFLASMALGLCFVLIQMITTGANLSHISCLAASIAGAFAGSLAVTAVDLGLSEVNMPPPPGIIEKVRQRHLDLLGGPAPECRTKYLFDIFLAMGVLISSAPLGVVITFLIWWEDPGPIFFIKNSVGKNGINFHQLKFRTMIQNAENDTGPVLARKNDQRMLVIGKFLRKVALDELPQIINILRGEMSFVGPRPQRTMLVCNYLNDIPKYALRHKVRPGLAGLAQVAGHYYVTPLQKLRFDRIYVRHMNTIFDLKIILCAVIIVSWLRWQKSWDGRLPEWVFKN
jgi:lipopolysaccharide/colanic/teichoic acid biosynthesis glycosyltransferase